MSSITYTGDLGAYVYYDGNTVGSTSTYSTSTIAWPAYDGTLTTITVDPSIMWPSAYTYTIPTTNTQTWTLAGSMIDTSKCMHLMPGDLISVPADLSSLVAAPSLKRCGVMLSDVCWCNEHAMTGVHYHVHWFDELSHERSMFPVLSHIHASIELLQRASA